MASTSQGWGLHRPEGWGSAQPDRGGARARLCQADPCTLIGKGRSPRTRLLPPQVSSR